jgi:hypothetical protein
MLANKKAWFFGNEMDVVWIIIGGFVLFIGLSVRAWLFDRQTRAVIFGVTAALLVAGLILTAATYKSPALFPSLLNPSVSLGLFVVMHKGFVRWQKRDPIDTFMDWRRGLAPDRLFNILYLTLGLALWMLLCVAANLTGYKWY